MKNLHKHPLFACILDSQIPKSLEKPLRLKEYDGKGDPDEHLQLVDENLNHFDADEVSK